jgi:chromosome segregation ATPase
MIVLLRKLAITIILLAVVTVISYGFLTLSKQDEQASLSLKDNKKALDQSHTRISSEVQGIIDSETKRLQEEKVKLDELRKQYSFYGEADTELANQVVSLGTEIIKKTKNFAPKENEISDTKNKVEELLEKIKIYNEVAESDKKIIRDYISELQSWSNNITPTNSGLTQTEINKEKSTISILAKEAEKTLQDIVKYENILKQEEKINNIVENIEELKNTTTNSGTNTNENPAPNTSTDNSSSDISTSSSQVEFHGYSYESSVYTDDAPKNGLVPVIFFANKKSADTSSKPDILQGSDL